jgi:hypothetical protein
MELFSYILSQFVNCWSIERILIFDVDFVSCYIAEAVYGV